VHQAVETHAKHGQPLTEVVVQLSGESGAVFLLRFDQALTHRRQRLFVPADESARRAFQRRDGWGTLSGHLTP
jgi:hypothetical protein